MPTEMCRFPRPPKIFLFRIWRTRQEWSYCYHRLLLDGQPAWRRQAAEADARQPALGNPRSDGCVRMNRANARLQHLHTASCVSFWSIPVSCSDSALLSAESAVHSGASVKQSVGSCFGGRTATQRCSSFRCCYRFRTGHLCPIACKSAAPSIVAMFVTPSYRLESPGFDEYWLKNG